MDLEKLLPLFGAVLSLLAAFITFLCKSVKNGKAKKALQHTLQLTEALQQWIVSAETFMGYSGAEKKEYVLTKVSRFAMDNKLKFDAEQISAMIDQWVATTKKVNMREKDKAVIQLAENSKLPPPTTEAVTAIHGVL